MARLKVAVLWPVMKLSCPRENLATLTQWAGTAAGKSAQLLLLPETFITGYATESMYEAGYADKQAFLSLAEPVPGPSTDAIAELSNTLNLHICAGLLERDGDSYFNTQVITGPEQGYMGKYRKIQIASTERWFSQPGTEYPIFDICGIPTGIMLCRDKSHPEIARILAIEGAHLILNPHCTPDSPQQPFTSWSMNLCRARAMENGCYLIANNCVFDCPISPETQAGYAFAIDPYGNIIFCTEGPGTQDGMAIIEVDSNIVRQRRDMEGQDFNLWSRSPEVYHRLVATDSPHPSLSE